MSIAGRDRHLSGGKGRSAEAFRRCLAPGWLGRREILCGLSHEFRVKRYHGSNRQSPYSLMNRLTQAVHFLMRRVFPHKINGR